MYSSNAIITFDLQLNRVLDYPSNAGLVINGALASQANLGGWNNVSINASLEAAAQAAAQAAPPRRGATILGGRNDVSISTSLQAAAQAAEAPSEVKAKALSQTRFDGDSLVAAAQNSLWIPHFSQQELPSIKSLVWAFMGDLASNGSTYGKASYKNIVNSGYSKGLYMTSDLVIENLW